MAKKVRWTNRAIIDRIEIYKYWVDRNSSNAYSEKLEDLFKQSAEIIAAFPQIGTNTQYRSVKAKTVGYYKMFYREFEKEVQILRVWDTRRNPDKPIV